MPHKSVESRVAWEGPAWRLRVHTLTGQDGSTTEKGVVEHPGSVVLVPVQNADVVVLRQYRLALEQEILELPAGTRGWDEPWEACAQRELREETGYRAGSLHYLGHIWPAPGLSSEKMAIYVATDLGPDPLPADFDEEIELRRIPLAALAGMALDGQLADAKSVVAILRAQSYLQERDRRSI